MGKDLRARCRTCIFGYRKSLCLVAQPLVQHCPPSREIYRTGETYVLNEGILFTVLFRQVDSSFSHSSCAWFSITRNVEVHRAVVAHEAGHMNLGRSILGGA